MSSQNWERVREIFDGALAREDQDRHAYVEQACGADVDLRREIQSLLAAHEESRHFIETPAFVHLFGEAQEDSSEWIGRRIGVFRITREVGRGGMSQVYEAERDDGQFEQKVAIKILRPGYHSRALIERFRAERRVLATFNHPNIAHLLDGGSTEEGKLYLVMEYVLGQDIFEYCAQRSLSVRARVELFRVLCAAVQHVHQRLTIHGDLKCTNVLVTPDGTVKLLDFGLARLLANPEQGTSGDDSQRLSPMTPSYASPEQLRGEPLTTATDIYSLGVVLHRLLTGVFPACGCVAQPASPGHVCNSRMLLPSEITAQRARASNSRDLEALSRTLRGDLDQILMGALAKDALRRYPSVEQFADDLNRWLLCLPIRAHESAFGKQVGKFVRRHMVAVAASVVFVLTLVGTTAAMTWQAHVIGQERARAERESAISAEVTQYLSSLFDAARPENTGGKPIDARALVDQGHTEVERRFHDQPELHARMLAVLASLYCRLGAPERCQAEAERGLALQRSAPSRDPLLTAQLLHWQGRALVDESRFAPAEAPLRQAASGLAAQHKPGDPDLADTLEALGTALRSLQHYQESIVVLEQAKRLLPEDGSGDVLATANILGSLALSYQYMERPEQALETARRSLDLVRSRTGTHSGAYLEALDLYANLLGNMDRFPESSAMFQEVVEGYERMFGVDSARTLDARQDLAATLMGAGRLVEAERAARQCVDTYFRLGVQDGQNYANAAWRLGRILFLRGDLEPSVAFLRSAYNSERGRVGENAFAALVTGYQLARSLTRLHQFQEAHALLAPEVPASMEGDYPQFMRATRLRTLGELQTEAGDYAGAHVSFEQSARAFLSVTRGVELLVASVHESEGLLLMHEGRYPQAVAIFRDVLAVYEKLLPFDSAFRQGAAVELAAALRAVGDLEQANTLEAAAAPVIRRELLPTSAVRELMRSSTAAN